MSRYSEHRTQGNVLFKKKAFEMAYEEYGKLQGWLYTSPSGLTLSSPQTLLAGMASHGEQVDVLTCLTNRALVCVRLLPAGVAGTESDRAIREKGRRDCDTALRLVDLLESDTNKYLLIRCKALFRRSMLTRPDPVVIPPSQLLPVLDGCLLDLRTARDLLASFGLRCAAAEAADVDGLNKSVLAELESVTSLRAAALLDVTKQARSRLGWGSRSSEEEEGAPLAAGARPALHYHPFLTTAEKLLTPVSASPAKTAVAAAMAVTLRFSPPSLPDKVASSSSISSSSSSSSSSLPPPPTTPTSTASICALSP